MHFVFVSKRMRSPTLILLNCVVCLSKLLQKSVTVGNDPSAKVSHIACIGLCVYVAMETGGVIHCYNAASQEYLFSMDTMASVAQMLTGRSSLIRCIVTVGFLNGCLFVSHRQHISYSAHAKLSSAME